MHFHIASTLHTPEVQISLSGRAIVLRGACFPENAAEFFEPIQRFLKEHLPELGPGKLYLHLELTYLNSAARKELWYLVSFLLEGGVEVEVVLYRGTEEDELEDCEELLLAWQREPRLRIEEREGYYEV